MTWLIDHFPILLLLGLYTALMAHHAWSGKRQTQGVDDFYVGGRSMGGLALGLSFFATYSSTNSFVGFSGRGYSYGLPWLLLTPFLVFFCLMAWIFVAPRLRYFAASLDSLTIPDLFGFRYDSNGARLAAALLVILSSLFYMAAIFKGIGHTLEAFLDIPYWIAILIVFVVVVAYTALGGFISIVKTDIVQGIMLIFSAIFLFAGTVRASGGIQSFFDVQHLPGGENLFSWNAGLPFPVLLGVLFAGTVKFMVEPRQLSRFYALKDKKAVRTGMWVSTVAFAFVFSLLVPIGIYARNIFPTGITDTDRIIPMLLIDSAIFHPFISAFLMVTLVAAAMSSLDSVLLVVASTCQHDILELCIKTSISEKKTIRNTGWYVALFALLTTLIALDPPGDIVLLTAFSGSLYAACFFPGLILGLYWRKGNGKALLTSFSLGLLCLLSWKYFSIWPSIHEVFPSLLISTLSYVLISLITPQINDPKIKQLFDAH